MHESRATLLVYSRLIRGRRPAIFTIAIAALCALGSLLLYLRTLVPGVYVSDFAEFQYQPLRLGLPHPNGFPFYMLLGWLWSHLPLGSVAWRMNALSAVGGALAVGVTAGFVYRLSRRAPIALLAAGLLALSPTFWYYSLAAERYTLNLALLAACWWSAWEAGRRQSKWPAVFSAFLFALGLATHPSDMLMLPFWLGYLLLKLPTWRRQVSFWMALAVAGATPLLLYLYVPLRWIAFGEWPLLPEIGRSSAIYHGMVHVWYEAPLTADRLIRYILGLGGYAAGFLAGGWQDAIRLLDQVAPYWLREVPWMLLAAAGVGALGLARVDSLLVAGMGGFSVLLVLMVSYITQGKNDAYLLPAFWTIFVWTAFAASSALDGLLALQAKLLKTGPTTRVSRWIMWAASLAVLGALCGLLGQRYAAADLSRAGETARTWEVNLKHPLEPGAGLLGHWSDLTPLWYLQQIEGRRTDLTGLFPPDTDRIIAPWVQSGRPLYLIAPLHGWALDLPGRFDLMPWGRMVRILPKGQVVSCPSQSNRIETPASWPFRVIGWSSEDLLTSERPGIVSFCWQARTDLPRETFLRLRLRPADTGHELSINEPLLSTWYPLSHVAAGTVGLAVIPIQLPPGTYPGRYQFDLAPYILYDDGPQEWPDVAPLTLGEATAAPTGQLLSSHLTDEVLPVVSPSAGPLILRGWHVSRQPVRPGDPVQLELLWEVRSPLRAPLTLHLGLRDVTSGRTVGPLYTAPLVVPANAGLSRTILRSKHALNAPRGRGAHLYLIEPSVWEGNTRLWWWPTMRWLIPLIRVHDRPHEEAMPPSALALRATFGELADLAGHEPLLTALRPGQSLTVVLYWQVRRETDRSYAVFVHLLDASGQIVTQHDGVPGNHTLPTTIWVAGEVIRDEHMLVLPPAPPAGRLHLRVGLYDPTTGERLPVVSDLPVVDRSIEIATIWVQP
ncbi:MAG: DUF2723 domain-containing protein [Anaerolineae bacterium]